MTPEELLERLINGDEIDWTTFEDVVFEAAKSAVFGPSTASAEIERHRKGPIDIVLTVRQKPLVFGSRALAGMSLQTAYIECKHYNRSLEFTDAAKVFCVAMKDGPNALVIVSSKDMAPQAWEYARHFFTVDQTRGVFAGVHFDHRVLSDFLGLTTEEEPVRAGALRALRWTLRASDAFTNRVVARSESVEAMRLDPHSTYTLEVTPGDCTHEFVIERATGDAVELRLSGFCTTARRRPNRMSHCTITSETVAAFPTGPFRLVLNLDCKTSGQVSIGFPAVEVRGGVAAIDDMRRNAISSWAERLGDPDGPNIVFVGGEGGIGKTHFCRSVCDALHRKLGYRCLSLTSTVETSESVFFRILWSLIIPEFGESSPTDMPDRELMAACMTKLLSDDRRADAELVAEMISEGDLRNVDVEVLTYLCARLLSQNPTPRTLLISNVQNLAPHVLSAFELLFSAIADQAWGNIRILLEYRTGEETPRLHELLERMTTDYHGRVAFLKLQPLTEREVANALAPTFDDTQRNDLAAAMFRKAGGNPLFLLNIILWAIDEGYISRGTDGRQQVNDWPGLERELDELPSDVYRFLDRRVTRVLDRAGNRRLLEFLIAGAFSGYGIDEVQIRRSTSMTSDDYAAARFRLCSKGILADNAEGTGTTFAHEIMMLSARSAVAEAEAFSTTASEILDRLDKQTFSDMLLGGRVSTALHQSRGALSFYNSGFELARNTSAFHQQCLALTGAHAVLAEMPQRHEDLTRRFVDITLSLAEAELMGGSMTRADRALREVLDVSASEKVPSRSEATLWRRRALTKRIQLFTRLMKPRNALQEFARLLETFEAAPTLEPLLRDSMTRILLALAMANRPAQARLIATALLGFWDDMPPNEQSSLCSDIGRIYLQANPDIASEWWHRGVSLATDARQLAHSRLNAFIVDLLRGLLVAPGLSAELRREASALGVHNQILRIDLADSVTTIGAGDLDRARHLLNVALRLSRSTSQVFWEWKILNNLAVIAVLEGRQADADQLFRVASSITQHLREFADSGDVAANSLLPRDLRINAEPNLPPAPRRSGVWHLLTHNIEALSLQERSELPSDLAALAVGPLRAETRIGPLYLALE